MYLRACARARARYIALSRCSPILCASPRNALVSRARSGLTSASYPPPSRRASSPSPSSRDIVIHYRGISLRTMLSLHAALLRARARTRDETLGERMDDDRADGAEESLEGREERRRESTDAGYDSMCNVWTLPECLMKSCLISNNASERSHLNPHYKPAVRFLSLSPATPSLSRPFLSSFLSPSDKCLASTPSRISVCVSPRSTSAIILCSFLPGSFPIAEPLRRVPPSFPFPPPAFLPCRWSYGALREQHRAPTAVLLARWHDNMSLHELIILVAGVPPCDLRFNDTIHTLITLHHCYFTRAPASHRE